MICVRKKNQAGVCLQLVGVIKFNSYFLLKNPAELLGLINASLLDL